MFIYLGIKLLELNWYPEFLGSINTKITMLKTWSCLISCSLSFSSFLLFSSIGCFQIKIRDIKSKIIGPGTINILNARLMLLGCLQHPSGHIQNNIIILQY
ncbi:hypothetical protein BpHYR1_024734 [Brachionus plicatilis]|uniref:Uncharacterized protein n=1 Tax=Brachionus plicatilis TaxID=10195 RepID=A0A3M7P969_BRAPC|nr:hypothetical protein BpHYR1_024734 [Brachionus plicatilis]